MHNLLSLDVTPRSELPQKHYAGHHLRASTQPSSVQRPAGPDRAPASIFFRVRNKRTRTLRARNSRRETFREIVMQETQSLRRRTAAVNSSQCLREASARVRHNKAQTMINEGAALRFGCVDFRWSAGPRVPREAEVRRLLARGCAEAPQEGIRRVAK